MKGTIIFKITVSNAYGGFVLASNFISKICSKDKLSLQEVEGISSLFCNDIVALDKNYKEIVKYVLDFQDKFKEIKKPEYLYDVLDNYKVIYCLWIKDDLMDVIELQYDSLIKQFFNQETIVSIISGSKSFYYKASHYLYDIGHTYEELYNSTYYIESASEKRAIRLQKKNVGGLTHFMPVHFFNEKKNMLFDSVEEHIEKVDFIAAFTGEEIEQEKYSPMIRGGLNLFKEFGKYCESDVYDIVDLVYSGNVLTFLIVAYSLTTVIDENRVKLSLVKSYFYKMKEYAMGCEQLVENVIHHSTSKAGAIAIRFYEKNYSYLNRIYGEKIEHTPHLEILITDYAGINQVGNIADCFKNKIEVNHRQDFEHLQPIDFLIKNEIDDRSKEIDKSFAKYYSESEHIGKHIGLKVFRRIVETYEGIFGFYSHKSHIIQQGERYKYCEQITGHNGIQCMPGTGYTLLFPLKKTASAITRAEIGIDDNIHLEDNIDYFINGYECENRKLTREMFQFSSQDEKEKMIYELSQYLFQNKINDEGKKLVVYSSAQTVEDEDAEYIAKALLMIGNQSQIADYVFYNCSKGFEKVFQNTMRIYFEMKELDYLYENKEFVIALYTRDVIESSFFIPGHLRKTIWANRKNSYAGAEMNGYDIGLLDIDRETYVEDEKNDIPPYDILYSLEKEDGGKTIFEEYTLQVLNTDIQDQAFGCKISDTHMRLGSTIHIDNFYEAELLFNNRLFASRFAYILVKRIYDEGILEGIDKITLYSYALYSENLIAEIMNILQKVYPSKNVDYAILERESEHREFTHIDRIRYSNSFVSKEEKDEYFKDRKIICIVPINSTLKTHEKLISLFCEDNKNFPKRNVISNFALILVGSEEENPYWKINEEKRTFDDVTLDIKPIPNYCILVKVKYYEAFGCELCFPKNPLDEVPIIEVNAASTIPNQSFGLHKQMILDEKFSYEQIWEEEEKLEELKTSLIYSHTQRGENHYLYYFKTDELFVKNKKNIIEWLKDIDEQLKINKDEYHVLFCPAHFSNAGFLECINRFVFHDAALIIRVDVDKEYRSNIVSKYSNLSTFIKLLSADKDRKHKVKVYYIDDSIITGRTFYRSKSLISSIVNQYSNEKNAVEVHVFEKVFVLLDRNSKQSRLQYIENWSGGNKESVLELNFLAYRTLHISSMRNHGDSCVLCQLEREAKILFQSAATHQMAQYWQKTNEKFKVKPLRDKQEEVNREYGELTSEDKAYRRMVCSHIATKALSSNRHGNEKGNAVLCILELLIEDYVGRKEQFGQEMAFEYMMSYLKILSRPFMVFDKTIKESAFDVQLIMMDCILGESLVKELLGTTKKKYLEKSEEYFCFLVEEIIRKDFSESQKMDLFLLLMKQLTEMKSNYFIRVENIEKIASFVSNAEENGLSSEKLYRQYLQQTKKILGVSSDTSKSAWFSKELSDKNAIGNLPEWVLQTLVIENTRAYFDGIDKLSKNIKNDKESVNFLCTKRWYGPEYKHYLNFKEKLDRKEKVEDEEIIKFLTATFRIDKDEVPEREMNSLEKGVPLEEFKRHFEKNRERHKDEKALSCIQNLKERINTELSKAQYRDFKSVLEDLGYIDYEADEDGAVSIGASVQLLQLCRTQMDHTSANSNIEEVCFQIACLIEKIIHAKEVKVILESPLECEMWKDEIRKKYNNLVEECYSQEERHRYSMKLQEKKEYLEIANSSMSPEVIEGVENPIARRLMKFKEYEAHHRNGLFVDKEENFMVWEMGATETSGEEKRKFLLYAEFYDVDNIMIWKLLRNLLCMYHILNTSVFNIEDMDYLLELILADKERLLYNLDKAHSHTATTVRSAQYECAKRDETINNFFRTSILTLLADLQVSKVYRQSLKDGYYCKKVYQFKVKCEDIFDILFEKRPLVVMNYNSKESKYLNVDIVLPTKGVIDEEELELQKEDKVLICEGGNAREELCLLIIALIMNAAGKKRGSREISETGQDEILDIKVYVTKTKDGCLRIANQYCGEKINADSVNQELEFPPRKDKGISLWSVSRYVQRTVSICLNKFMMRAHKNFLLMNNGERKKYLMELKEILEYSLGEDFAVKADIINKNNGIKYFHMDIPILVDKYKEIL